VGEESTRARWMNGWSQVAAGPATTHLRRSAAPVGVLFELVSIRVMHICSTSWIFGRAPYSRSDGSPANQPTRRPVTLRLLSLCLMDFLFPALICAEFAGKGCLFFSLAFLLDTFPSSHWQWLLVVGANKIFAISSECRQAESNLVNE